jgi:hypothetical protein
MISRVFTPSRQTALVGFVAVLLACCAVTASAAGSLSYYTEAQQINTRKFLASFADTMPALAPHWTGDDFCQWIGVTCSKAGVQIGSSKLTMLAGTTATLPEVPSDVDGSQVVLTIFTFSSMSALSGTLPPSWGSLTRLVGFSVGGNSLTGTLPPEYGNLVNLWTMNLFSNRLTGTIPPSWGQLSACTLIALYNNSLTGTLPDEWNQLPKIRTIYVHINKLSGTLPWAWQNMTKLSTLYLNDNAFTGSIPSVWGNMTSISSVMVADNNLCGCVPQTWIAKGVTVFGDAAVTSDTCATTNRCCNNVIPYFTAAQQSSTYNFLSAFTSAIPDLADVWYCRNFCEWDYVTCTPTSVAVDLSEAVVTGSLPNMPSTVTGADVMLTNFSVGGNTGIAGTLPPSWATLANLAIFNGSGAAFSGTLPASWGGLSSLAALSVDGAALTGSLPASWASLTSLQTLSLAHCNLNNTLPISWRALTQLTTLHLNNNALNGSVPEAWGEMTQLSSVTLQNNGLCGCLPAAWTSPTAKVQVTADEAVAAADCATANACPSTSTTRAPSLPCSVPHCLVCNAHSPNYCKQCEAGYHLTAAFLCREQSADATAAPLRSVLTLAVAAAATLFAA